MGKKTARGNLELLGVVWKVTKGWKGICYGIEFWIAILVWFISSPYWLRHEWWEQPLSILPTVLGFTITGFAIFLGFGSDDFKRFLARGKSPDENSYMSVGAAFVLFVCVQLIAILFALTVNALQFPTPSNLMPYREYIDLGNKLAGGIGYFVFLYGILLALRAALRIYRLSRWYTRYLIATDKDTSSGREKRFIQISSNRDNSGALILHAVASDGTLWVARADSDTDEITGGWRQLDCLQDSTLK